MTPSQPLMGDLDSFWIVLLISLHTPRNTKPQEYQTPGMKSVGFDKNPSNKDRKHYHLAYSFASESLISQMKKLSSTAAVNRILS